MKRNTKEYAVAGELFYMITCRVFHTILRSNDFSATASTVTRHTRVNFYTSANGSVDFGSGTQLGGPRKGLSDSPRTRPVRFSVVFN